MSIMISMIYVDDSYTDAARFEKMVREFKEIKLIGMFSDAESALEFCSADRPDLALVDIVLPGNNGLWLASKLKEMDVVVAFTSAYDNYAYDAFKVEALHYIPRPVTAHGVRELVERMKRAGFVRDFTHDLIGETTNLDLPPGMFPKRIYVNTQKQILILQLEEIVYIEAEGSYTNFHLSDGRVIISGKNLKNYSDTVERHPDFVKIHRSYIINQEYLEFINKRKFEMTFLFKNKKEIKVATFRKGEWMNRFM